jgi:hypothetical protein
MYNTPGEYNNHYTTDAPVPSNITVQYVVSGWGQIL